MSGQGVAPGTSACVAAAMPASGSTKADTSACARSAMLRMCSWPIMPHPTMP
jgi:hypothetical protein